MPQPTSPSHPRSAPLPGPLRRAEAAWREGLRCVKRQQLPQARRAFRQATDQAPGHAMYWINLARLELQLGDISASHDATRQAQAVADLDQWPLCTCLTVLYEQVRDYSGVLEVLDAHAALRPGALDDPNWQVSRTNALVELRHWDQAVQPGMQAIMLTLQADQGQTPEILTLRRRAALLTGHSLAALKRHNDAALCYRMAVDADPLAVGCALYAAHYSAWTCDWPSLQSDLARLETAVLAVDALPPGAGHEDMSPFSLIGLTDDPVLMRWAAEHANRYTAQRCPVLARDTRPVVRPEGRLRIGILSSDFFEHATCILMAQMLEHIDSTRYALYFYSNGPDDGSALRQRVLATACCVHEVFAWSSDRVVQQIKTDQIGVLIDLKGFTSGARMDVLAARPAPLQVAWLGFPGTVGNAAIDYQIGDPVVTPIAHQADFTECIAQLPRCYQPNDSTRSLPEAWTRARCSLPEDAIVLASFNQSYKTTEPVFATWCDILHQVPRAVMWLLVGDELACERLRAYAAGRGVNPERLVFAPFVDADSHRARIQQADLALDTFPCGGHTTTSDLLWAGVPVLTLIGRTFAARVAGSLLTHIGLPDLVCDSLDTYREQAVRLCQDPSALPALRLRVATGRQASGLFDGARYAQDWQDLIERIVARQDSGLPPAPLEAVQPV